MTQGPVSRIPKWLRASPSVMLGASLLALLLLISRQPSAVVNPQLFAEDGRVWFQNAYQFGAFPPLLWPYLGYLETFQRLIAGAALLLPLSLVPAFFIWVSLVVEVLPVAFLTSDRLAPLLPRRRVRLLIALGYLVIPAVQMSTLYLTQTQWCLAVLAVLVVLAPRSKRPGWRAFDFAAVALSGLSGPYALFLAPAALALAWIRRTRGQVALGVLVVTLALLQTGVLIHNLPAQRSAVLVAVHLNWLVGAELVATRMILVPVLGTPLGFYASQLGGAPLLLATLTLGAVILAVAIRHSSIEERLAVAVGLLTLVATMAAERHLWPEMLHSSGVLRYWFFPTMTWLVILAIVAFRSRTYLLRPLAVVLLCLAFLAGGLSTWEFPAVPNRHFQAAARQFKRATPGQDVRFQEDPPGWSFLLTKR
ncbi:MAG: hypothetical protein WB020_07195 [Candidatus Dormiibacterota bacterium]